MAHRSDSGLLVQEDNSWKIDVKDLIFSDKILGKGGFGVVTLASYLGTDVAVKTIELNHPELKKFITRELTLLRSLRHPQITQFIGACQEGDDKLHIAMEFASNGNLRQLLKDHSTELPWSQRVRLALDAGRAMAYLHSKKVIHRDLKSKNFLLHNGVCKLCDFGLARVARDFNATAMTIVGTEDWMAPEVIMGDEYDDRADVFSFGIVMIELLTREKIKGKFPRGPRDRFTFPVEILRKMLPSDAPDDFVKLTLRCLADLHNERPPFEEIVGILIKIEARLIELDKKAAAAAPTSPKLVTSTAAETPEADLDKFRPRSQTTLTLSSLYEGEQVAFEFGDALDAKRMSNDEKQQKLIITQFRVALLRNKEILESIPLTVIMRIEKVKGPKKGFKGLEFLCSNFRKVVLCVPSKLQSKAYSAIGKCISAVKKGDVFAYQYKEKGFNEDGWLLLNWNSEFRRLGLAENEWRISKVNENYEKFKACSSLLFFPATVSDAELTNVSFTPPILSWKHPKSAASLFRSSELLKPGSVEKTLLMKYVQTLQNSTIFLIFTEAKPKLSKIDDKIDIHGLDLEAPSTIASTYTKLLKACLLYTEEKWLSNLNETRLLQNIASVIRASLHLLALLENGCPCVLMSHQGFDRTTQLLSVTQVLLEPFFRTTKGFATLIEKEWCAFSARFMERFIKNRDAIPIFFEFLDVIHQLLVQFPTAFEFNNQLLVALFDQCQFGLYGTFLYDREEERVKGNLYVRTVSFWSEVNKNGHMYKNPMYRSCSQVLVPSCSLRLMRFWGEAYTRDSFGSLKNM